MLFIYKRERIVFHARDCNSLSSDQSYGETRRNFRTPEGRITRRIDMLEIPRLKWPGRRMYRELSTLKPPPDWLDVELQPPSDRTLDCHSTPAPSSFDRHELLVLFFIECILDINFFFKMLFGLNNLSLFYFDKFHEKDIFWNGIIQPREKKVLVRIGSNIFFYLKYWKFAKKVLDPILSNTFFLYGQN